ncbi:MAG: metallophosphoesterase [Prolixibacteraceae bacterium]|nr:metallophosphoesterase [Prolixibacteraceae bacterium]
MKLQIISDIHLEFGLRDFDFTGCDLLICAGDIHLGEKGLQWLLEKVNNIPVVYVLGNHEYYKNAYPKLLIKLKEQAAGTNIHVLENDSFQFNDVTFHGTTLWTNFELYGNFDLACFNCEQRMNDYRLIRRSPSYSRLRATDTLAIFRKSFAWLKKSFSESKTGKNVLVTHHAPSIRSVAPAYKTDVVSAAFASNLEGFILDTQPNLWVHGHIHTASDYTIGSTRVICNPVGYPFEETGFNNNLFFEL